LIAGLLNVLLLALQFCEKFLQTSVLLRNLQIIISIKRKVILRNPKTPVLAIMSTVYVVHTPTNALFIKLGKV